MSPTTTIGARLRAARQEQNLSLSSVAEKLGVSAATLSRIETDKQNVDVALLVNLSRVLETTPAELLRDDEEPRDEESLVRQLARRTPEERVQLLAQATKRAPKRGGSHIQQRLEGLLTTLDVLRDELIDVRTEVRREKK
jgi:transcriptional regulator with XRE-family HTH domain